jgi:hypothetical protein
MGFKRALLGYCAASLAVTIVAASNQIGALSFDFLRENK